MSENELNGFEELEEVVSDESFENESLLSFDDSPTEVAEPVAPVVEPVREESLVAEEVPVESKGEPPPDDEYLQRGRGMSVDEILKQKQFSEKELPKRKIELSISAKAEADVKIEGGRKLESLDETPPPAADMKFNARSERKLEISSPPSGEGKWKVDGADEKKRDMKIRSRKLETVVAPQGEVRVDHEHLAKLDNSLRDELIRIKEKAVEGVIPGNFLEARKRLAESGTLMCPTCRIQVEDIIGKVDYCPKCGLALDDHFGQYKAEWEKKHKHTINFGVAEFGILPDKREMTSWERWKDDKGIEPDAELLVCPQCGYTKYDDPFIASRCHECKIPLDLHLEFPRESVRRREAKQKGRRAGMDRGKFDAEKLKGKPE